MAKKTKEPIKIRFKDLANGCKSIYLDIYVNGNRKYEFLKLYIHSGNDKQTLLANEEAMRMAEAIKAERIIQLLKPETTAAAAPQVLPEAEVVDAKTAEARQRAKRIRRDPVTLRSKKIKDGSMSLYLDIYYKGKRSYEFLKLYLLPEESESQIAENKEVLAKAEEMRRARLERLIAENPEIEETEDEEQKSAPRFKIHLTMRKLSNGGRSFFMYIHYGDNLEQHSYESLGLYTLPTDTPEQIKKIRAKADAIRKEREEELRNGTFVPKREIAVEVKADVDHYKRFLEERHKEEEQEAVKREKKRNTRSKEPVRIRFKDLANGSKSIYLAINVNGKRSYEYLKLYLIPESDASAKAQNKQTMEAVYAIKAQRVIEITNRAAGIKKSAMAKMRLLDWLDIYRDRQLSKGYKSIFVRVRNSKAAILKFSPDITLEEMDRHFLEGFVSFLKNDYVTYKGTKLTPSSVDGYVVTIKAAMNAAVQEEILQFNPLASFQRCREKGTREYLTIEEVKKLIDTPCRREDLKQAFLFSCFCGLRISDVRNLKWRNVIVDEGNIRIEITQYKTQRPLALPLNKQALRWMPERGNATDDDPVFKRVSTARNFDAIIDWGKAAGIKKRVTFHVSRHTFATMELTMGADLYTTSKLLGHTSVQTTQIYAKVINSKKVEAVSLLDGAFE